MQLGGLAYLKGIGSGVCRKGVKATLTLLKKLRQIDLLSARGLLGLAASVLAGGVNLMALLRLRARLHPERTAVVDDRGALSYAELWRRAEASAVGLHTRHGLRAGQKIAIICRNHSAAITAIFAGSRLGASVFMLNPQLSADQLRDLAARVRFDLIVHDEELAPIFAGAELRALSVGRLGEEAALVGRTRLGRAPSGSIVVLTSGTTGAPKAAGRRPAILSFLPPFLALLDRADLGSQRRIYVATPLYHGYGLAMLLISLAIGSEIYINRRFDAARACALIADQQIAAAVVVPLMLQRMLRLSPGALTPLCRIICGSAPLSPALARETIAQLGPILFNLYGTSEAGFAIMATPDLLTRKPAALGRPLPGVRAQIGGAAGQQVGRLSIRSAWSASRRGWVDTGDLAYRDIDGDIFLAGRADDMIISGGENVYPIELENILALHPAVAAVAAVGISDPEFGQRLRAFVVLKPGATIEEAELRSWLKPRIARHQTPAVIEFRAELPYTAIGKPDKKALRDR